MSRSREDHRKAAEDALNGVTDAPNAEARRDGLLEALVEAVLALSALTAKELQQVDAEKQFFKELENRDRR